MNIIVAPEGKFAGICKILDLVLAVILAAVFAFTLCTYFDFTEGQVINPEGTEFAIEATDSFSLLGYVGFPEQHEVVNDYYQDVYGEKTISIKQIGVVLFLDVFAIIAILFIFLKKGIGRTILCTVWGLVGTLGAFLNHFLILGNTWVKPAIMVGVIAALAIGLIASVLYAIDTRAKYAYLRSMSAAYK